jgi:HK97 family phage portal protein
MGLGSLFTRDVKYTATDTDTGLMQSWVVDGLSPDWATGEYQGALALPGAWRASLLLSGLLGGVPWHAYRTRGDQVAEEITPTPAFLEQPAPPDPRVVTFSSMALDLIWHGNAIALIAARDRAGWPTAYVPVPAENVQVRRVEKWDNVPLPVGTIVYVIGQEMYSSDDVVHVKGPSRPGALRGLGVLECHLNGTLALATEQGRQARSLQTSGVPVGTLTVEDSEEEPLDEAEAAKVKAGWLRSQRDRTIAVLNSRTKFEAISWNPSETQLLEARKFSLHETALIFGLDPSWLGVSGASMTYSNVEQEAVNLIKFSLGDHLQRFEQTFTLHMPRGTTARANLDAVLRADTLTRYQAHSIALDKGFLTVDEVRALESRPPLTPAQRAGAGPAPQPAAPVQTEGRAKAKGNAAELRRYWTKDPEGLAKWATTPKPWTNLLAHLIKYLKNEEAAKALTSSYYKDVFGHLPGED